MMLTKRDHQLMCFLSEQGVATFAQLRKEFFVNDEACRCRLRKLLRRNLIESISIDEMKKISVSAYLKMAEILNLKGSEIWKYRLYRLSEVFRKISPTTETNSDPKMWRHQVQLTEVRQFIKEEFPNALILTESDVESEWRRFKSKTEVAIPDLVLRSSGKEVAIEMERTLKSEREYQKRMAFYGRSKYTHVIYFCESVNIFNKIARTSAGSKKIGVSNILSKDKIYRVGQGFQPIRTFIHSVY